MIFAPGKIRFGFPVNITLCKTFGTYQRFIPNSGRVLICLEVYRMF